MSPEGRGGVWGGTSSSAGVSLLLPCTSWLCTAPCMLARHASCVYRGARRGIGEVPGWREVCCSPARQRKVAVEGGACLCDSHLVRTDVTVLQKNEKTAHRITVTDELLRLVGAISMRLPGRLEALAPAVPHLVPSGIRAQQAGASVPALPPHAACHWASGGSNERRGKRGRRQCARWRAPMSRAHSHAGARAWMGCALHTANTATRSITSVGQTPGRGMVARAVHQGDRGRGAA